MRKELTNLADETIGAIARARGGGVAYVGTLDGEYLSTWEEFYALAKTIDYDAGFGRSEIADDLVIVLRDGTWLERREYDGQEWWRHVARPLFSDAPKQLTRDAILNEYN